MYGSFSNDVAYAMPDQRFHRDAGIGLDGIGVVHQRAGDAVRDFVWVARVHFFDHGHFLLIQFPLARSRRSIRSSWGEGLLL